jgi:hypothetical protein
LKENTEGAGNEGIAARYGKGSTHLILARPVLVFLP